MAFDIEAVTHAARPIASTEDGKAMLRPKAGMDWERNADRVIGLVSHNVKASCDGVMLGAGAPMARPPRDLIG